MVVIFIYFVAVKELECAFFLRILQWVANFPSQSASAYHKLALLSLLVELLLFFKFLLNSLLLLDLSVLLLPFLDKSLLKFWDAASVHFVSELIQRLDHFFEFEEARTLNVGNFLVAQVQNSFKIPLVINCVIIMKVQITLNIDWVSTFLSKLDNILNLVRGVFGCARRLFVPSWYSCCS